MKTPKDSAKKMWDSDRAISCIRAAYWASCVPLPHKKRHLSIYFKGCDKSCFLIAILPLLRVLFEGPFEGNIWRLTGMMMDFCEHRLDKFSFNLDEDEYGVFSSENRPYERVAIDICVSAHRR